MVAKRHFGRWFLSTSEKVRVTHGPLRDHVGVIHAGMTARQRVAVMFQMFSRETQIDLHERDLIAV